MIKQTDNKFNFYFKNKFIFLHLHFMIIFESTKYLQKRNLSRTLIFFNFARSRSMKFKQACKIYPLLHIIDRFSLSITRVLFAALSDFSDWQNQYCSTFFLISKVHFFMCLFVYFTYICLLLVFMLICLHVVVVIVVVLFLLFLLTYILYVHAWFV